MGGVNIADLLVKKLPEPKLRQLAEEDTNQKISVIVEPDLPPQKLSFTKIDIERNIGRYLPKRVVEETAAQQKKNARKIDAAHVFLESLLGETPHWLKSARAFVVTVKPEQLREIAQSSLIKTIRLNRNLQ
jgi:hypothetical protein